MRLLKYQACFNPTSFLDPQRLAGFRIFFCNPLQKDLWDWSQFKAMPKGPMD